MFLVENIYEDRLIPVTSVTSGIIQPVTTDVFCLPIQIANVVFIGRPGDKGWVLVDAGMPRSSENIISAAEERYGRNNKPAAIILTHGHFDHVGAITDLIDHWDVPVYAHELELPFLTGKESYPKGDPTVDAGLVAKASPMFPNHSINLDEHIHQLDANGQISQLPDWQWIHTPGHTKGHISLYREKDGTLIAGDAFVTVKQESLYKVITQTQEISGPPKYFTTNWDEAWESVNKLQRLSPNIAVTGHGQPMSGMFLKEELEKLSKHFDTIAIPEHGRYVH